MTDKVKIIYKEIERLAEVGRSNAMCFDETRSEKAVWLQQVDVCERLLSFIKNIPRKYTSEDLEEAAENFANEVESKVATPQAPYLGEETLHHLRFGFVQGANWRKEQMMANAVTLVVKEFYGEGDEVAWLIRPSKILDKKFHIGDKVKIILIKEE